MPVPPTQRIGIIGLDTSHSVAFSNLINNPGEDHRLQGYRVVAAYPYGSSTIESSTRRIPGYIEEIQASGVEITDSIAELLRLVDYVLLETHDGHLHYEQIIPVLEAGKPVFIDKPLAGSLLDVVRIFNASEQYQTPVFSSSSLRYMHHAQAIRGGSIGKVLGADTYSPAIIEPSHPDLYWYGMHGVETLFTVMGTGCQSVQRIATEDTDMVIGIWNGNRIGTFRGIRSGSSDYGGIAFGEHAVHQIGPYEGYTNLVAEILQFFRSGVSPVSDRETLEIYAFMEAADESKRKEGIPILLENVLEKAKEEALITD